MLRTEMNRGTSNSSASHTPHTLVVDAGRKIVLEGRDLSKTYGVGERSLTVFQHVNLALQEGEMVAIVAPSGAGKSTLLHLLATLDTPTSGTVYFANKAIETNQHTAVAE